MLFLQPFYEVFKENTKPNQNIRTTAFINLSFFSYDTIDIIYSILCITYAIYYITYKKYYYNI